MRYFRTSNASRSYKAGGFVFDFETLYSMAGSWVGSLEVENEEQADALATVPQVVEITKDEFDQLKKKVKSAPGSYQQWRSPSLPTPQKTDHPFMPNDDVVDVVAQEISVEDREIVQSAVKVSDPLELTGSKAKGSRSS